MACFGLALLSVLVTGEQCPGIQAAQTDELKQAQKEYDEAVEAFRTNTKLASEQQIHLMMSSAKDAGGEMKKWKDAIHATNLPRIKLEQAAIRLFVLSPNPDQTLVMLMYQIMNNAFQARRMGVVYRIGKILKEYKAPADQPPVNSQHLNSATLMTGLAAVYVGDLELGEQFATDFRHSHSELDDSDFGMVSQVPYLKANAAEEQQRNASAKDQPRVRLQTEYGDVIVELFEDDAPLTVNSFIYLVERGFYDNTVFDSVLSGKIVQGGIFGTDRQPKIAGFTIPDEHHQPGARRHVYGSLFMAKKFDEPDSASSMFGFMPRCNADMDGNQTVFGRVISGMEIVEHIEPTLQIDKDGKIEQIPGAIATTLLKADVLNKRDHEYLPPPVRSSERQ